MKEGSVAMGYTVDVSMEGLAFPRYLLFQQSQMQRGSTSSESHFCDEFYQERHRRRDEYPQSRLLIDLVPPQKSDPQ